MSQRDAIAVLGRELVFPEVRTAPGDRPLAIGGDLSVGRLLLAYRSGIFPWSVRPITWWSPDPRCIIPFEEVHVSRSLRRALRKRPFEITVDSAFRRVITECSAPGPGRGQTWIKPEFIEAYCKLHAAGHAHSVECWMEGELVGGVYGVAVRGLFAGESMFHRATDASKVALVALLEHLSGRGFVLFDTQMVTPVTRSMGAREVPRDEFLDRLDDAMAVSCAF